MKLLTLHAFLALLVQTTVASPLLDEASSSLQKRDSPGFADGQPIDGSGKGGPILGSFTIPHRCHY